MKNNNVAVKINHVYKKYYLHHEKPTLIESLLKNSTDIFTALKDVNITIYKGQKIGIIGKNGSGKTTLLKIIVGITTPTRGSATTHGKIVSLIDLAAGFHPDLSGIQNIFLNSSIIGMSRNEIKSRLKGIIHFADIGNFIDAPFYTYSSGMALRLGFSIAVHSNPDILVLDENISVGDKNFTEKSTKKIKELIKQEKTVIVASHDLNFIKSNCDKIFWMEKGQIYKKGGKEIISLYRNTS